MSNESILPYESVEVHYEQDPCYTAGYRVDENFKELARRIERIEKILFEQMVED